MKMIWVAVLTAVGIVCINVDEYSSKPCENGGKCCCVTGFIGDTCENIDECSSNPCENGATCIDGDNKYTCSCAAGFNGDNCETNIDECSSNPCENNTHTYCDDGVNSYTCLCHPGFGGLNCENPYIVVKFEDDRCVLPKDFHSITAGDLVDSCKMWCIRNSTCRAFVFDDNTCHFKNKSCGIKYEMGGFTYYVKHDTYLYSVHENSNCPDYTFFGSDSEYLLDTCKYYCNIDHECGGFELREVDDQEYCILKRANCRNSISKGRLFGRLYVKKAGTGICVINPCANGGACIRVGNNYTCSCAPGFNGRNCETNQLQNKDECSSNPCENGDICVDGYNKYTCWCPIGTIRAEKPGVSCKKRPNKFSVSANQDCLLGKSINSMKPDNLYDAPNCKAWCYNNYTCGGFVIDVSPNTYRPCLFKTNDCRNDIQDVFVFPHASFLFIIAD